MRVQFVSLDFRTKQAVRYINGRRIERAEMLNIDGTPASRAAIEEFRISGATIAPQPPEAA